MEKVEVDPKLFVTCRLCLDDMGMYQIIPNIQNQIKYCFDIDVAPFDGLPQLICKKCEGILSEYFSTKTAYVAKQQLLINTLQSKNIQNDATVSDRTSTLVSSQVQVEKQTEDLKQKQDEKTETITDNKKEGITTAVNSVKKKRRRIESSSSDSSHSKESEPKVKPLIIKKAKTRTKRRWHNADYNKYFSCRVCNKNYVKKDYFMKHYKNMHSTYLKKYSHILNKVCSVKIEKVDNKTNFTGVSNTVVLSKDKVLINNESSKYYITYTSKNQSNSSNDIQTKKNNAESSDSSDSAEYSVTKKRRKKLRRLLSTVSTDTVVIEKKDETEKMSSSDTENHVNGLNNNIKGDAITECITLDSDSDNDNSLENKTADNKLGEHVDNKLIRNIIDVCHSKYMRNSALENKKKPSYASIESQLKHKVLNLGRKIINKQGLNCTGLLRFLEYRNLGIIWLPKTCHTFNGPPVRISMTTLKKDHMRTEDSDVGWTDVPSSSNIFNEANESLELKETNKVGAGYKSLINNILSQSINVNDTQNVTTLEVEGLVNSSQDQSSPWEPVADQACLYKCDEGSSSGKLLNKNPVANPKQLPKKTIHYEIKQNKHISDNELALLLQSDTSNKDNMLFSVSNAEAENDLSCMPIITSTTSLATEYHQVDKESNAENKESSNSASATGSTVSVPRIKVKPVSELMAENVTPNSLLINQNNMYQYDQSVPNMTQCIQQMQPQNIVQPASVMQIPVNNALPQEHTNNSEFLILDTIDLPNTKTNCPFRYLQTLLAIHNIILVENMSGPDYRCLIKFKVLFKQESVKPIVLCLSLHCNMNKFFIGLKDSSHVNIDMQKISANWQWEIIKIFQGDVCNKVIQTALKMGLEVHDYSKKFLCLLKAIQMRKVDGSQ